MIERMIGASRLNVRVFEEVEHDKQATMQALLVVVLVAVATGIGLLGAGGGFAKDLVIGVAFGILGWFVWAYTIYVIGTTLFRTPETQADWGELARTTGFAQSPGVLRVFGFIPAIGPIISFAASLWQFAAMIVAVRQALDYRSTWRALGVVVVGFFILGLIQTLLFALL